jgi:hypothetical protein
MTRFCKTDQSNVGELVAPAGNAAIRPYLSGARIRKAALDEWPESALESEAVVSYRK